jgi:DNA topoisomerase-3
MALAASAPEADGDERPAIADTETPENRALPPVREGDAVTVSAVTATERMTKPPKRFTDTTLVQAMTKIAKYVTDPKTRQILRETDGIGTPATQASIIQTLLDRNYVAKKGRQVISTPTGRALIQTLPSVATTPDMTAVWESAMRRIHDGEMPLDAFLQGVLRQLDRLVAQGKALGRLTMPGARACPAPGCGGFLRRRKGPNGTFWSCTGYPACKHTESAIAAPRPASAPRRRRPAA